MKVVVISNDPKVTEVATISVRLRWPDAIVVTVETAAGGLELVESTSPDIVLLHPDFTDISLAQTIKELRGFSNVPLLVLDYYAVGAEMKTVIALETGADYYVRLPCNPVEIMARVSALLRRMNPKPSHENEGLLYSGSLMIDSGTHSTFLKSKRVILTSTEFRLLHLLVRKQGMVVEHQTLERAIRNDQANTPGLAKKYIQRLRRKLGDDAREPRWIASVHGVGYRFIGPAPTTQLKPATVATG